MEVEVIARTIHVIGVVLWIGGVAMVTTVMIPSLRSMESDSQGFKLFHTFERRFASQARVTVLLTAISGFYMLYRSNGWARFHEVGYWWLFAMIGIWFLFFVMLFIIEPFVLPKFIPRLSGQGSKRVFPIMHIAHQILLLASLITIAGAVSGSHGFLW